MSTPVLKARGLVKRYGRVTALDHADFDLYPGEILAVIGDNGAGKSSLIKAISGAVRRLRAAGIERGLFKDLPGDLMANLFFAPVGYMLKTELKGRHWTEAELDAAAEAVLDSWRA